MRAVLLLCANVLRFGAWCIRWPFRRRLRHAPWLWLSLGDRLDEIPTASRGLLRFRSRNPADRVASVEGLRVLGRELDRVPREVGLAIQLRELGVGWATLASAHQALSAVRESGRRVVVYLEEGADQRALYLASAADEVWVGPSAGITVLGPLAHRTFVAPLLRRVGIEVGVMAAGDYKSAADGLVRESMTAADREQRGRLLTELVADFEHTLSRRTGCRTSELYTAAVMAPEAAKALGAVDHVGYLDQFEEALGIGAEKQPLKAKQLAGHAVSPRWVPLGRKPHLAVVRLVGAIGAGMRGIDLRSTRTLLRELARRKDVAGVILFIDSPGGSAVTSDLLHREVVRLDGIKPVLAVCGDVAASGGYYLAVGARKIWARPTTITGSIGVISVRAAASALLDRLGIRSESLAITPAADLFRYTTPLTPAEVALLEAETQRFYTRFLQVVAEGRQRALDEITPLAGGRIWTGSDALEHGLIDALGGLPEALLHLRVELSGLGVVLAEEPVFYAPRASQGLLGALMLALAPSAAVFSELDELHALAGASPLTYLPRSHREF